MVQHHLSAGKALSLLFAIPDHPWVDSADGAAVRIAMTVAATGERLGLLRAVVAEKEGHGEGLEVELTSREGKIFADLKVGIDMAGVVPLIANKGISSRGVSLHGSGFIVSEQEAKELGLGRVPDLEDHIRRYRNGKDLTQKPRGVMVIDLFGLSADEVRRRFPEVLQWVYQRVKPGRDHNKRASYRERWWVFGEPRKELRPALEGLARYIATVETSKHRFFVFLDRSILPDNKLINIALEDGYYLGILSSRVHLTWALASGSRLGVGNDPVYVKTRCFETFLFPDATASQKEFIRDLAEQLDAHRKRQQELHAGLTMTGMYNVLEKLRAAEPLSSKDKTIHEQGLVSVLRQLHDELDAAVSEAYGWPSDLGNDAILERLVDLHTERAAEERKGLVRWLRPDYQNPDGGGPEPEIAVLGLTAETVGAPTKKRWPKNLPEQVRAVRTMLAGSPAPATAKEIARDFRQARTERVGEILETLAALGQVRAIGKGRYSVGRADVEAVSLERSSN